MRIQRGFVRSVYVSVAVALTLAFVAGPAEAAAALGATPHSGPAGTSVVIKGSGFRPPGPCSAITISFTDATGVRTTLGSTLPAVDGSFRVSVLMPATAATGGGTLRARQAKFGPPDFRHCYAGPSAQTTFTVTGTAGVSQAVLIIGKVHVRPSQGPPGTSVIVKGDFTAGIAGAPDVHFQDAAGTKTDFGFARSVQPCFIHDVCVWRKKVVIPANVALGAGVMTMANLAQHGSTPFTVTGVSQAVAQSARVFPVRVRPVQGPPGTTVKTTGTFLRNSIVQVSFVDSAGTTTDEGIAQVVGGPCYMISCTSKSKFRIPAQASVGAGLVDMVSKSGSGSAKFTVTAS